MSERLAPFEPVDASNLRVAVVSARWYEQVMDGLLGGAVRALDDCKVESRLVVRVPGSLDLPVIAASLARQGFDAVVALGVVVRGGTPEFDHVSRTVTDGLAQVALESGVPVGFGILVCDTEQQALDRCGRPGSHDDRGYEAVHGAVSTALTLRQLRHG